MSSERDKALKEDLTPQLPKGETVMRAIQANSKGHSPAFSSSGLWITELRAALAEDVNALLRAEVRSSGVRITRASIEGLRGYVDWHGGAHEPECPKDDTCECSGKPLNAAVDAILAADHEQGEEWASIASALGKADDAPVDDLVKAVEAMEKRIRVMQEERESLLPKLLAAAKQGYALSTYAASARTDGSPNTPEWLQHLFTQIEATQLAAKAAGIEPPPGTMFGERPQIKEPLSKCCKAPIRDAGECSDGCCDKFRCTACGKTWYSEVAQ